MFVCKKKYLLNKLFIKASVRKNIGVKKGLYVKKSVYKNVCA